MREIKMEIFVIYILLFGFVFGASEVLELNQGKLTGSSMKTRNGREFKAFQGIPYAKSPTGDLRFKDPEPADPWVGVLDATTEPQACIQKNLFYYQQEDILVGSEDCLYLNVYTPKIPKKGDRELLPVMFWIAGGGYFSGSGGLSLYGPQYLLDKDIVLVTFNYRIGILGFLSTEDDVLPGNYGMKDQVLALKWVKKNIDKFGGNRKKVTLFGQSAGSASVGLHLLSPMSKGLFHKAIMESATPLNLWGVTPPSWAKRRASAIATIAGCPEEPIQMVKCLKEVPAKVLVNLYNSLFEWRIYPIINFMPVAENCNKKKESFLCKYPLLDFKQKSKVPVLIGMNSGEGGIFASRMYNATGLVYTELKEDFDHYVSSFLEYRYTTKYSDISIIGDRIFERYFPDGTLNDPLNAVKMISGGLLLQGIFKMAIELSRPVYYYIYDHLNYVSFNSLYGPYPFPKKLGVTHADEVTSLFYTVERGDLQGEDLAVSNLMVNIWTNFATTDSITIDGTKKGVKWPKFNTKKYEYVLINTSIPLIKERPNVDEYEFWNSLPLLSGLNEHRGSLNMHCIVLVVFTLLFEYVFCTGPVINVHEGQLKGKQFLSRNGRNFFAFQGIPYAKPPVGPLRFKAPEPISPWKGVLNATSEPSMCIQKNLFMYQTSDVLLGSEDCLYLNVYTSKLPKIGVKNLPVMVWIPGGGFSSGHGGMRLYGPKYLMDKDIVLVTINYRIGLLGFLSTEDDILPGNYGLKDQALALRWVQDNIAKFGGDSKKVTLFGESAGAVSVGLHLLSPLSKGLFHKAILQSGSPFCQWAVLPPGLAERRAKAVATITGCPSNSKDMIECLRLLPAESFVQLNKNFYEWEVHPSVTFSAVVEKCHEKKDSFLCNYPLKYYKQESLVPIIIGLTSGEGGIFASRLYNENGLIYPEFKENFRRIVPLMLLYHFTASYKDVGFISDKLKEHYFPEGTSIAENPNKTVDMMTGGIFLKGVIDMANHVMSPVHFYVYDYANKHSFNTFFGPCPKHLGVTHGDEMISLFDLGKRLNTQDANVSKLMVDIWTNFAISDKLTVDGKSTGNAWPRYNKKDMKYLLINSSTPVLSERPFMDEYNFWSGLPLMSSVNYSRAHYRTEL
ncbi:hypothetical protein ACI65C_009580 [Semiaphis heraclei]